MKTSRTKIVALFVALSMMLALPALAGATQVQTGGYSCGGGQQVRFKFKNIGPTPVISYSYWIGYLFPLQTMSGSRSTTINEGGYLYFYTGKQNVSANTANGGKSMFVFSSASGQPNPAMLKLATACVAG